MWLETILALLVVTLYQLGRNVRGLRCFLPVGGFNVHIKSERRNVAFAPWAARRRFRVRRNRRGGCNRRPCQGVTPPVNFLPEHFGIPRPKDTSNCNPRSPMPEDKDAEGPAPTAPTAPQPPIGSKPLNAEAQVFKPQSSSQSPTSLCHVMSSAPSPSQSSSPLPSLTNTTISPLLSSAGKVLNISNENLRYRSMSSLNGSPPPPSSPPGLSQGYGKGFGGLSQWVDEDRNRMVHLERLANRMV